MIVGTPLLGVLFWLGLVAWWILMSALLGRRNYTAAVLVAYLMPTLYAIAAFFASRRKAAALKLLPPVVFVFLGAGFAVTAALIGAPLPLDGPAPYLGIAFIAAVMSLMQYPRAGLTSYESYRPPVFIAAVIFMPLFIFFAAFLPTIPAPPALDKIYLLPIGMLGFWLSAAWLASRAAVGTHVEGLEIARLLPFRPDFILPAGVIYVKGTIVMGIGLMIAIHPHLGMPKWNWWGFVLAFWGIIAIIPVRGMYKMAKSRRLRMLGVGGVGFGHEVIKGLMLFAGLLVMLYGFVNAFFGVVPFQTLLVTAEFNAYIGGAPIERIVGTSALVLAFALLVFLRGWYKLRLLEGAETTGELFLKQLLLWLGTVLLLIAFIELMNLPPVRDAGYPGIYPAGNPIGLAVGSVLFLAGSILILVLRPPAPRNELRATIAAMAGVAADQPEHLRNWVIDCRLRTLAAMPQEQRDRHVAWMMDGLSRLPSETRASMMETQMKILASTEPEIRRSIMSAMDHAAMGGR
jgi:hypothetical protein